MEVLVFGGEGVWVRRFFLGHNQKVAMNGWAGKLGGGWPSLMWVSLAIKQAKTDFEAPAFQKGKALDGGRGPIRLGRVGVGVTLYLLTPSADNCCLYWPFHLGSATSDGRV